MMNALKIFSENYINGDCAFTCSSGSATAIYLYDQKPATKFTSSGSDDTVEETVEIVFKNWQGSEVTRTFDRIIMLSHNIKSGGFDYWDGSAWVAISAAALTGLTDTDTLIELAATVSSSRLRVRAATTQTANVDKEIGELKVCQKIIDGSQQWRSDLPREDEQKSGSFYTGDGQLVAWREWTKFAASGTLHDVEQAAHDLLFPCLTTGLFYTVIFWDDFDLTECFEVHFSDPPKHSLNRKTGLYEISLRMEEK